MPLTLWLMPTLFQIDNKYVLTFNNNLSLLFYSVNLGLIYPLKVGKLVALN